MINTDNICALATPSGGAIGIVRVSGPDAIGITNKLFSKDISQAKSYSLHYGVFSDTRHNPIDEVMVSVFRTPHSYTGEDATEISFHGSPYVLRLALQALIDAGCRQAKPGEYTMRAYQNGKMDLSQAEAVADLVSSTNQATHKLALSQLKGYFSNELATLREQFLKITSLLELELDFSDHEELEFANRDELLQLASTIDDRIVSLAHSFKIGQAVKAGIPVAIIGRTNVGKSTLLNRLLHEDKAIVSNIHGTTRDTIEDTTDIHGLTFRFIDTAGIRHTDDQIEQLGIRRSYQKLQEAAIVLYMTDGETVDDAFRDIATYCEGKKIIIVQNKIDQSKTPIRSQEYEVLQISAKLGTGISNLEESLYKAANIPAITENEVIVTNARHYEALKLAHANLTRVIAGINANLSADLLSEDLKACLDNLADITGKGRITPQETLNNIFAHFCVGK
ncbi:tRNA uridine-5-carboxymethylaminomethyl(34) synthesis GTPase MnmE [Prevotella sp. kh1p2]|uniref:tRNA uridine-5-carboxymethylaminomethyl(34) synthesis GTPase MnmE n=1 Tax=Prevotella sp. kh1p2 TaxID=1761883 RepID=UPI0008AD4CBC|nr:tRNA uridine-5-carboxymethylaminomethyl(34) synthesis GTPase MnmE [Prevotella sp. kh1p2]SES94714.1 tRNA modification GTPase [Prevotella sp. kh1p2]SNU11249.1 tRNA modification GTPase [Prevotellaceae bacterium KH2P17]